MEKASPEEFSWNLIIFLYCFYIGMLLLGGILGIHTASISAAALLLVLYARYCKFLMDIRLSFLFFCLLFSLLIPIVPLMDYTDAMMQSASQDLIKYYALNFIILLGLSLPPRPINQSKSALLLYIVLLLFLLLGWIWPLSQGIHEDRVKGFLPNPNNFALTSLILLLLINESSPSYFKKITHIFVLSFVYVSRTSGALIGYACGMIHRFLFARGGTKIWSRIVAMMLTVAVILILFIGFPRNTFKPLDRIVDKFTTLRQNYHLILKNKKIDYYAIIENKRADTTSALWRLHLWHDILASFAGGPFEKILFGHGMNSTHILFGMKPHNDYLRLLFETGVFGFLIHLFIWVTLYRHMEHRYRWAVVMVAAFSLSENNYDHFPAMSFLALFMISNRIRPF